MESKGHPKESQRDEAPSVAQSTIFLHDAGDQSVTLLIGTGAQQQPVLVSTAVLRLASPIWNAMFGGRWAESQSSEIPFPDDDVDAMLVVLRIAHLKFKDLPPKNGLSFDALHDLAVVCDKYDVVKLVRPFLDLYQWTEGHVFDESTQVSGRYSPHWLFVAWTFGYINSFNMLAAHLARTIRYDTNPEGSVKDHCSGLEVSEDLLPPEIFESILRVRRDTLASMLLSCYETVDKVVNSFECALKVDEKKCRSMILGSFIDVLIQLDLYPVPRGVEDLQISVEEFQTTLLGISIDTHETWDRDALAAKVTPDPYSNRGDHRGAAYWVSAKGLKKCNAVRSHTQCGQVVALGEAASTAVSQMPSPTLESHLRHMEEQAKK